MRKLVIDIGNTLAKIAAFEDKDLLAIDRSATPDPGWLEDFSREHGPFEASVLSAVREPQAGIRELATSHPAFVELDQATPVPVNVLYRTPATLGRDRLAAVCGARARFPGENVLVIDAGTAITYDLVTAAGDYPGGAISPGISIRFKALNTFTGKLPLIEEREPLELIGDTTAASIISGVLNGVIAELDGIIAEYQARYTGLRVVITGGDAVYFDKKLKSNIFALPNLVLEGLNEILDWNTHKE